MLYDSTRTLVRLTMVLKVHKLLLNQGMHLWNNYHPIPSTYAMEIMTCGKIQLSVPEVFLDLIVLTIYPYNKMFLEQCTIEVGTMKFVTMLTRVMILVLPILMMITLVVL